ncbi:MAG: hypothetical protein A4S09_09535 [Proteobacteria bacterium SG_bin7]|nr:MAG: hypothetical protein A4S09_09535 [Proteobacteria bacterium SG_bin7]
MNSLIKVLIVVTSHNQLGNTGKPTGYYLSEVAHPYEKFIEAGIEVDIASPKGGEAPLDPNSKNEKDAVISKLMADSKFNSKLKNTLKLSSLDLDKYKAIVFAGGHGTMWDFSEGDVPTAIRKVYENNGVVAAICHGPASLVNVKLSNGTYLVSGKKVTGFSNAEEEAAQLTKVMPFLLETALVDRKAIYEKSPLWKEKVVVDGRLITGQNPASAAGVGAAVVKILTR